ncbi:MAG: class F sortase [Patescibacteria group bacterium]
MFTVQNAAAASSQATPAYDSVSIPSLGLSSRVVTVGTTASNAIDVHPSLVGWWNKSAQPGTPGAAFLDGHNPGVFNNLQNITIGAEVSITMASGVVYNYTVIQRETVPLAGINMRKALSVQGSASEGLNLMTCMGAYNPKTGTTDQRLVVYAVRS